MTCVIAAAAVRDPQSRNGKPQAMAPTAAAMASQRHRRSRASA